MVENRGAIDMTPHVTVFIPTLNAGVELGLVLDAVLSQKCEFEFEVLVFDSESSDVETRKALRSRGVNWKTIPRGEFDHGETRNLAAKTVQSPLIVFLSQDARPRDQHWLAKLVLPLENGDITAAYAAQVPRPDCHPFQRLNVKEHMTESEGFLVRDPLSCEQFARFEPKERLERIRFDNVSSVIRRASLIARPFPKTNFAEDLAWSRSVLLSGGRIAFCPESVVIHSHGVSYQEFYTRVMAVHSSLRQLCDFEPISSRSMELRRMIGTTLRFQRSCLTARNVGWRTRVMGLFKAPFYAFLQMEAMYRGSRSTTYFQP